MIFGARGTGKSTLIKEEFNLEKCYWIDLLDPVLEDRFSRHPEDFRDIVLQLGVLSANPRKF